MAKQKDKAKEWLQKISRAKKVKEDWRNKFRVSLAYSYWEGAQRPASVNAEDWITINMIYSNLQAELPSLYSNDPYYYIKLSKTFNPDPSTIPEYEMRAKTRQSMLNYLKKELKLKQKARMSIFDAHFQYGVMKYCYYADLTENPSAGNPIYAENDDKTPLIENGEPIIEPDYIPANEAYKAYRIHPDDFLVDEDAGPLDEDVIWRAQRIRRNIDEVKADKRYSAKARRLVVATEIKDDTEKEREARKKGSIVDSPGEGQEKKPDIVVIWEVWDRKNKQWLTLAEGLETEFLINPSDIPKGIEVDPFVDLRWTLRDDSWYPLPPISQWLDPQTDYCDARSKLKTHRKRFNRKYHMESSAYDDPESAAAKLTSGEDGTVVMANRAIGFDPVKPIADAPLDQQLHTEIAYLRHDFDDVATGANQRGRALGADASATEAGILETRSKIREGDKQGLVIDFLADGGRKLDMLVQANLTTYQAVKVSGPQGEFWQPVTPEDYDEIPAEYEYSVDVGSVTPQLPEIMRAQWIGFVGALIQAPYMMTSKRLMQKTAEMFNISDETMVGELVQIGQQMMQAQAQGGGAGAAGGQANLMSQNPVSSQGGAAAGINNIRGGMQ
jgi:hypothetical protein